MSYENWKYILNVFELWRQNFHGILVNKHILLEPTVKEVTSLLFFSFFFSPFFFTDSLNSTAFLDFMFSSSFFFFLSFLLHKLAPTAIFFLLLHSLSFFSSLQKHMGNFIQKKNTWVPISQTQKIKLINTWYRSYTLTHKHKPTNMFIHTINLKILLQIQTKPRSNKWKRGKGRRRVVESVLHVLSYILHQRR